MTPPKPLRERAKEIEQKYYGVIFDYNEDLISDIESFALEIRRETIEECAKLMDEFGAHNDANEIRALAGKT